MPGGPLAISLGDPAGVGPELIAAAWVRREAEGLLPFCAVGGPELLAEAARRRGLTIPVMPVMSLDEALDCFDRALPTLAGADGAYRPGAPDSEGAELALASLEEATRLTVAGEASALVTGPIAKARLAEVGFGHPGQTEFVAAACGMAPRDAVMMLAGPSLRTVPLTVHIALSAVPAALTSDLIVHKARIVAAALARDFGIDRPRLALAALNPHAGEEGRMGDEEARIIAPALATLKAEGLEVTGPHPADALFAPRARAGYDAALCMYHDQALIPLKTLDFDSGVNVTLGLPVIRTSPDHGTAFSIAGTGQADPGAMIAAIRMAGECALRRAEAEL
ncbi:4-hydroxythreonine-4-phosphate dehydrogenase PdxA [Novosphingobium sp.]|uniref:4-hydroxythreonine-4-phosphate dehydrogenase PdxA n=1 Tax=Novosphingobium sp. TaxID=1874826 RepID=UPI001EB848BC|nr:4-hydroxythreonine-4-phosphate dehydrogenase PdxA [Novosphingobium sp.]MBK9010321.1 4-hydroxythreonine-4-phosphate dehydrogenase PdxA [Novosphingobium sp.]